MKKLIISILFILCLSFQASALGPMMLLSGGGGSVVDYCTDTNDATSEVQERAQCGSCEFPAGSADDDEECDVTWYAQDGSANFDSTGYDFGAGSTECMHFNNDSFNNAGSWEEFADVAERYYGFIFAHVGAASDSYIFYAQNGIGVALAWCRLDSNDYLECSFMSPSAVIGASWSISTAGNNYVLLRYKNVSAGSSELEVWHTTDSSKTGSNWGSAEHHASASNGDGDTNPREISIGEADSEDLYVIDVRSGTASAPIDYTGY